MSAYGIEPETPAEARILADPRWQEGAAYEDAGSGHPEPCVGAHIRDVLDNVDEFFGDDPLRERLRLVALTHDTFKHRVRWFLPWRDDHAKLARAFAAEHVDDPAVLDVVEVHDEAFRAWRHGRRTGRWADAEARAKRLIERLGDRLPLFLAFYRCDNATGDKSPRDREWFEALAQRRA